jgi:hypothetical protein
MGPENETTRDDEMKEELSSSTSLESKPFKTYTPAFVSRTASPLGVAHTVQQLLDREIIILFDFYFVDFYTHNTRNKNALFTQHSFHTTHGATFYYNTFSSSSSSAPHLFSASLQRRIFHLMLSVILVGRIEIVIHVCPDALRVAVQKMSLKANILKTRFRFKG